MKKLFSTFLIIFCSFQPLSHQRLICAVSHDAAITIVGGTAVSSAPQLDEFINTITFNKGVKFDGFTKVVPILSIGSGTRIGAAQVGANTKDALDRTKAVAQLEGEFQKIRAQALIPIDKEIPISQFKRVKGVGVTAIIDVKL